MLRKGLIFLTKITCLGDQWSGEFYLSTGHFNSHGPPDQWEFWDLLFAQACPHLAEKLCYTVGNLSPVKRSCMPICPTPNGWYDASHGFCRWEQCAYVSHSKWLMHVMGFAGGSSQPSSRHPGWRCRTRVSSSGLTRGRSLSPKSGSWTSTSDQLGINGGPSAGFNTWRIITKIWQLDIHRWSAGLVNERPFSGVHRIEDHSPQDQATGRPPSDQLGWWIKDLSAGFNMWMIIVIKIEQSTFTRDHIC